VRRLTTVTGGALALCLLWGSAWADTIKLTAQMAPVTPEIKAGKGTAALSLDTADKTVSWTIDYSGVKPPAMGAFMIPGPKPSDDPTPLIVDVPANAASPIKGSTKLTDPQVAGIQSGAWWIMIGSKDGPEIGGQIKKAP
jgi:CHRD domain